MKNNYPKDPVEEGKPPLDLEDDEEFIYPEDDYDDYDFPDDDLDPYDKESGVSPVSIFLFNKFK